jgi:SepF-like predicted cell division protein (DUF552 family)
MVFQSIKKKVSGIFSRSEEPEYVEIDINGEEKQKKKIIVRPFVLKQFDEVNEIINSLREGYTIAVIDIKPLRTKDVIELKRAISKIRKTAEALEGSIAGFGENVIIVTPQFAEIYRNKSPSQAKSTQKSGFLEKY